MTRRRAAAAFATRRAAAGAEMSLRDMFYHPLWVISTTVLAVVVRLQRRLRWSPDDCDVRLAGKTVIVTGANTGELRGAHAFAICLVVLF